MNRWMAFTGIGFELVGLILLSVFLGPQLEEVFPLKKIWTPLLLLLALGIWMVHILSLLKKMQQPSESQDSSKD